MPYRLIDTITQLQVHDHLCLLYRTWQEQLDVIVPYIQAGLQRGEQCFYIADDNTPEQVLAGLEANGIEVQGALASGSLIVVGKQDAYLKPGYFDPDEMERFWLQTLAAAKSRGFPVLRISGEMTWALGAEPGVDRLLEYEARLNRVFPTCEILAICQYNRVRFPPEVITQVIKTHPMVIYGNRVYENPYFVRPEEFLKPGSPEQEVERLLSAITARRQAETQLQAEERLHRAETEVRLRIASMDRPEDLCLVVQEIGRQLTQLGLAHDSVTLQVVSPEGTDFVSVGDRPYPNWARLFGGTWDVATGNAEAFPWVIEVWRSGIPSYQPCPPPDSPMHGFSVIDVPFSQGTLAVNRGCPDAFNADQAIPLLASFARVVSEGFQRFLDIAARTRAEEEQKVASDVLAAVVNAAPVAIMGVDLDGKVRQVWNKAAESLLGWTADEAMGRPLPSVPSDKQDEFADLREMIRAGRTLRGIDVRRQKRDGTPIEYSIYASPLHDAAGRISGNVAVLVDLTERRWTELAMRRAADAKATRSEIAGIFLATPDEEVYGAALEVVRRVLSSRYGLFGYLDDSGSLVIPSLTREIWKECQVPGKSVVFPPESWGESLWGRAIRERRTLISEGPFHSPTGHVCVKRFLAVPLTRGPEAIGLIAVADKEEPYTAEDREVLEDIAGYLSPILRARLQRDAQERIRVAAEAALRESEEKYRLVVENASEVILVVQEGRIVFANGQAAVLSGWSAEELAARSFLEFIHPDDRAVVATRHQDRLAGKEVPWVYPFRILGKDGQTRWVEINAVTVIWAGGPATLNFLRDVSDRHAVEEALQQQQLRALQADRLQALGEMAAGIAHEMNQPLNGIRAYAEGTLLGLRRHWEYSSDDLQETLADIVAQVDRITEIIDHVRVFSRDQGSKDPVEVSLDEVIQGALKLVAAQLRSHGIEVQQEIPAELPPCRGWPTQLEQVVLNLLSNARDALDECMAREKDQGGSRGSDFRPVIGIRAASDPGQHLLRLDVSDNADGVPAEVVPRIFEPFFTTKDVGKGTGLGLAIARTIVEKHQGRLELTNRPGEGAIFSVILPAIAGPAPDKTGSSGA